MKKQCLFQRKQRQTSDFPHWVESTSDFQNFLNLKMNSFFSRSIQTAATSHYKNDIISSRNHVYKRWSNFMKDPRLLRKEKKLMLFGDHVSLGCEYTPIDLLAIRESVSSTVRSH